MLHSRGADVNAADSCGWTPLHSAAYWGKEGSCGALLSMGAQVSPVDIEGDTPLHNAAYRGWQRISNLLVQVRTFCVRARVLIILMLFHFCVCHVCICVCICHDK